MNLVSIVEHKIVYLTLVLTKIFKFQCVLTLLPISIMVDETLMVTNL